MSLQTLNFKSIFALLALYIGWGSTYMAIALALECFPPFMLAGIRFILAGLIFFLWSLWKGIQFPKREEMLKICLAGFLLLFLGSGSVVWVEQYLSSGLTSIVWASLPIWLVAMDRKRWKFYLSNLKLISGLLLGLLGVILLFADKELIRVIENGTLLAFMIAIFGVVCFAFGSLYSKNISCKSTTIFIVAVQMIFVGVLSLIISLSLGEKFISHPGSSILNSILGLLYLIIVGSLIAYFSYLWLLNVLPPTTVGTYTYVNPAIAILLGWWLLNENITNPKILALILIFIGVFMVNYYKTKIPKGKPGQLEYKNHICTK
ncbi:EamA family transporter [Marinifilum caeruleilacunae]|nr:EamA family transporter [Marinifilum caeruleilacunae]